MARLRPGAPLACLLMLCLAGGCGSPHGSNVESGLREQVLHFGNGDEPQDLDPQVVTGIPEAHVLRALFEGLVDRDPRDLAIEPGVADTWQVSPDERVYEFHLRDSAHWSDGEPVTAQDFVYAWKRALMPALGNQYAYLFYCIRNAQAFFEGRLRDFGEVGVHAVSPHILRVELERPTPWFLQLMDFHTFYPVPRRTIEKFGAADERGTRWTRPGNLVSNGPFMLKRWELNRILVVEKNPHYWDAARVRLREIRFYPVQNGSTEERMFRTGQLHITDKVPPDKIAAYRSERPAALRISPYLGTYFYRLNTRVPPLDDVRVRRALAMSIDRRLIVEHITRGGQPPAFTLTPPGISGFSGIDGIREDAETARRLLAEAGFPGGRGFPTLELAYNSDETNRRIAIAVQSMWKENLGIDVTLANLDWKVYLDRERDLRYQIDRGSWIGDYLDPTTFLDIFRSDSGNNRTGWTSPDYDALLNAAATTGRSGGRLALLQRASAILVRQVPCIPIFYYTQVRLVSPDVQGWYPNLLDRHPYKYLSLARPADGGGNP